MSKSNNFVLVGDSHVDRIAFGYNRLGQEPVKFSNIGMTAYSAELPKEISLYKNASIIVNFGEIDIRCKLPKYNNAEKVVDQYINKTLNKFGRDKVIFLEPTPQSEDKLIEKYQTYKYDRYPLEERIVQQEIFYKALNSYNLNVIKMKNAIGVDVLTDQYTDDGCHLNDKYSYVLAEYINRYLDIPFLPPTH